MQLIQRGWPALMSVSSDSVFRALSDTDGQSLWSSIQESSPREPDYSSIEQLFCLPLADNKDKKVAAPVKKVSKEVRRHARVGGVGGWCWGLWW